MSLLSIRGVERRFDTTLALQATDLDVAENDFITILGPSGCGKSTLLRTIAGLEDITEGTLSIGGRVVNDVPPAEVAALREALAALLARQRGPRAPNSPKTP